MGLSKGYLVHAGGRQWLLSLVLAFCLGLLALAQPWGPGPMGREIDATLQEFLNKGTRPYQTKWPGGAPMEQLSKDPDGTVSYTKFYPTGGYAVRYQRKPGKVVKLERYYSNGKTELLLIADERILDYTSYWENGNKKAKYQRNRQTSRVYYDARSENGRQVYPPPHR